MTGGDAVPRTGKHAGPLDSRAFVMLDMDSKASLSGQLMSRGNFNEHKLEPF